MAAMADQMTWGILGTGRIAAVFARGLSMTPSARLVAVASRSRQRADRFADQFDIPGRFGRYEDLLSEAQVQAVYISLPHTLHARWSIRCAEAGKHVLCEKPLTTNHAEAMAVVESARAHGVFLMEAFMYRCHTQTTKLVKLLRERTIGEVRMIEARFSFDMGERPNEFRLTNAGAGGGIMDVGCYTTSMARLIAGAALGLDGPAEPIDVIGCAKLREHDAIDEYAAALLRFDGGIVASCICGIRCAVDPGVHIWGSDGWIDLPQPWQSDGDKRRPGHIVVHRPGRRPQRIRTAPANAFVREAQIVADYRVERQAPYPAMSWGDSLGNMKTIDRWRETIGLSFESEGIKFLNTTVAGRPLRRCKPCTMKYSRVDGVAQPIAKVVHGSVMFDTNHLAYSFAMLDHYFEAGGNCIDTAWLYHDGEPERAVGQWIAKRGVRDQIVLIGKGAHTPNCYPDRIAPQLAESLDRLGIEHIDLYLLHRDNPDIGVDQFIEALNEEHRAGRIRALGASNWTADRVDQANAYAAGKGLVGFAATSNNLSLARWNQPPWAGCRTAGDPETLAWHERTQVANFAWSSQAQGFTAGRFRPEDRDDPRCADLARTWFNDANFGRLGRAAKLAQAKGVETIQVALAYVLCQHFPSFAIVGPETLAELRSSLEAAALKLNDDDMRYLDMDG